LRRYRQRLELENQVKDLKRSVKVAQGMAFFKSELKARKRILKKLGLLQVKCTPAPSFVSVAILLVLSVSFWFVYFRRGGDRGLFTCRFLQRRTCGADERPSGLRGDACSHPRP